MNAGTNEHREDLGRSRKLRRRMTSLEIQHAEAVARDARIDAMLEAWSKGHPLPGKKSQ